MNKVVLLGRLTKDCDVRYTQTGKVVCQFTMAVDRPFNKDGQKEADFVPVVLWGKQAEVAGNSLQKGHRVLVEGRLQIRSYDDNNGNKRYVTEVIGNSFEFIERKGDNGSSATATEPNFGDAFGGPVPFEEEIPF